MQVILDFFKDTFNMEFQTAMTGDRIASGLLVAFFLTAFLLLVYKVTYQGVGFSRSFCFSLILLSLVTSTAIMTVTTNLTLSLGMVGALSIIRFRTAVKDPADTAFMFWAITIGIMAGAGLVYIAIITNVSIGILYMIAYYIAKGFRKAPYLLVIRFQKEATDAVQDAVQSLKRSTVRSRTAKGDTMEWCLETRFRPEELSFIERLLEIQGVLDASAVSYRGDTGL